MDSRPKGTKLRELTRRCLEALELEQHERVSSLSLQISSLLVELYDETFHDETRDSDHSGGEDDERETDKFGHGFRTEQQAQIRKLVESLCQLLKKQSVLASAYGDVVEFVRLKDLVCLSRVVGVMKDSNQEVRPGSKFVDYDNYCKILRQSSYLLTELNLRKLRTTGVEEEIWINKQSLIENVQAGISCYSLNLEDPNALIRLRREPDVSKVVVNQLESLRSQRDSPEYSDEENENIEDEFELDSTLIRASKSFWFAYFCRRIAANSVPIERFALLVALWIIASECGHKALEHLMAELVDQILHEESNSCNEEEFIQLSQVGAMWVSYHKRFRATLRAELETDADAEASDDDEAISSSALHASGSSRDSSPASLSSYSYDDDELLSDVKVNEGAAPKQEPFSYSELTQNGKRELRKLIDDELLHGSGCLLCNYQSSKLFEPLEAARLRPGALEESADLVCLECVRLAAGSSTLEGRCMLSFRRLHQLISMEALLGFRPALRTLVLVEPAEWVRPLINIKLLALLRIGGKRCSLAPATTSGNKWLDSSPADARHRAGERLDIAPEFERLTVIRDHEDGAQEDEDDEEEEASDEREPTHEGADEPSYRRTLESFFQAQSSARGRRSKERALSQSLAMLKFVGARSESLAVHTAELLVEESRLFAGTRALRLKLLASSSGALSALGSGALWRCSARSPLSKLQLGCGRLFSSLELCRSHLSQASWITNSFTCPFCARRLRKLESLAERAAGDSSSQSSAASDGDGDDEEDRDEEQAQTTNSEDD